MTGRKFIWFMVCIFILALAIYAFSTPRGSEIPLIGVVDGNEVIVSPQITGRIVKLTVDEGSVIKKQDLIAELDRQELEANVSAARANVTSLEEQVRSANNNFSWTNEQTDASLDQARARVTSTNAQLEQVRAALWRDQSDWTR